MTILNIILRKSSRYPFQCIRLSSRQAAIIFVTAVLASPVSAVQAAEIIWELGMESRYSDNIDMIPGDGLDELWIQPSASISYESETPRLYADIDLLAQHINYTKDTSSGETLYFGDLVLDFHLVKDMIDWRIEDHVSNEPIASEVADVPDNRQNVNVFYTGPEFTFRLGQNDRIELIGGVIRTHAEDTSEFDSDRSLGQFNYVHTVSDRLDLGLSGEWEDVEFDELVDSPLGIVSGDYDRTDAYLTATVRRGPNTIELQAGSTDLDYDVLPDEDGESVFVRWSRVVSETAGWELTYRDRFTDASRTVEGEPSLGLGGINVSADVYRLEGLLFSYSGSVSTATVELALGTSEERYVQELEAEDTAGAEDRDVKEFYVDIGVPVSPRVDWISTISWSEFDYEDLLTEGLMPEPRVDKESYLFTGVAFQMRRQLTLRAQVGRHIIDSNDPLVDADENIATFAIVWTSR